MQIVTTLVYERIQAIGRGEGMNSEVFLARHEQLGGGILVVKEIPKAKLGNTVDGYFREADALFRSEHPHVVRVHYCSETPDLVCLAMPHYAKGSLARRIHDGPIALREAIRVGIGILEGLTHVHAAGFVHLDVKPSNVLFSDADEPLVADFGQARRIGPDGTAEVPPIYMWYVPPEVLLQNRALPQSDVFQAALTLYRAVNGTPHFQRQFPADQEELRTRVCAGKFPDRYWFMPHVPRTLATVIRRGLEADPGKRYSTAQEFSEALGRVDITTEWEFDTAGGASPRWTGRHDGRRQTEVRLVPGHPRKRDWDVVVSTPGRNRSQRKRSLCRAHLTESEAWAHLSVVFRELR